jgi:hypothetical protein
MAIPYFVMSVLHLSKSKASRKVRRRRCNPQCYPQRQGFIVHGGFNLCSRGFAISSFPDRSRLVLPDVTIAKVGSAWVRSRYRQGATW